jgi:hypothetical protein
VYSTTKFKEKVPGEEYVRQLFVSACKPEIDPENAFGAFVSILVGKVSRDCEVAGGTDFWTYDETSFLRVVEIFLNGVTIPDAATPWVEVEAAGLRRADLEQLKKSIEAVLKG